MTETLCIVTSSRADYGLLKPLIDEIRPNKDFFELKVIVTGSHLSPEFGCTVDQIEKDGVAIDESVEILLSSDSQIGVCKSMGLALISISEALKRHKPDLVILLGDRYEIFCTAAAALVLKIPIAHIHGGELTEGAYDDAFRHSITKMSLYHFTSTEEYRKRVIQMGEHPERVFNVGALGIDNIRNLKLLEREALSKEIGIPIDGSMLLVTYHPETLGAVPVQEQIYNLLSALNKISKVKIIFTYANADDAGRLINRNIKDFISLNSKRAYGFISIGQRLYLSLMQYVDVVVGNSSSGIIEAPSFRTATVNIGDRQKGRIKAQSIIDCSTNVDSIYQAIEYALSPKFRETLKKIVNPYEKNCTSKNIIEHLKLLGIKKHSIKKEFYNLDYNCI